MSTGPTTYLIRVRSHLDDHWREWLGDVSLERRSDGSTVVSVAASDQAQLHGVLSRLRDIGVVLEEVRVATTRRA